MGLCAGHYMESQLKNTTWDDPNIHPCVPERKRSMQCLSDNNYDYSKCQQFFDDFKKCKKDWVSDHMISYIICNRGYHDFTCMQ